MLTRLALMFVVHVMVLGVLFGRRLDFVRMSRLGWIFVYLVFFYIGWGLFFSFVPQVIMPDPVIP